MARYNANIMDINGATVSIMENDNFRAIYDACRLTVRSAMFGSVCALIADNTREAGRKTFAAFCASETLNGERVISFVRF